MIIDLTSSDVTVGDIVQIIGNGKTSNAMTVFECAQKAQLQAFQVFASMNVRLPRIYKKSGVVVAIDEMMQITWKTDPTFS